MEIDKKLLRALIADGEVDMALNKLLNIAALVGRADWQNHLLQVSANWNAGQKQYRVQTISHEQFRLERAQAIDALNQFISALPDSVIVGEKGSTPPPVGRSESRQKHMVIYLISSILIIAIFLGLAYAAGVFDRYKTPISEPVNNKIEAPVPTAQKTPLEIKPIELSSGSKTKPAQKELALFNLNEKTNVGVAMVSGHERNIDLAQKIAALLRKKGIKASHSIFLNTFFERPYFYSILEGNHVIISRLQAKSRMQYVLLVHQNDVVTIEKAASTGPALVRENSTSIKMAEAIFDVLLLDTASGKAVEQAHPRLQAATPADLDQILLNWIDKKNWNL